MYTLGINAAYHDSSACLVEDGRVIAAAEEERFTGIKHGKRPVPFSAYELPFHAIHFCLKERRLKLKDIDHVAYSYDPQIFSSVLAKQDLITLPMRPSDNDAANGQGSGWDSLFMMFLNQAPRFLVDGVPHHLSQLFNGKPSFQWHYVPHHLAHAASAFLPSPFSEAAVMNLDGRGEKAATSYFLGTGQDLVPLGEVHMPHSLGILYEQVTKYLGFLNSSDEYKVMALASYGKPVYVRDFEQWVHLKDQGQYIIEPIDFEAMFGPAREKGGVFEQKHFDLAHSLQKVLEDKVLSLSQWLFEETHQSHLCLAGGVALNCVMNAHLRDRGPFKKIWVQPAAGDAGTSLGAALWVDASLKKKTGSPRAYAMDHAYLGPQFSDVEIEKFLQWIKVPYRKLGNVAKETAEILSKDKIIGWFQGRMEFGPRALGGRSILASPMNVEMQQRLNEIKDREDFRPVAPVVLEEDAAEWFEGADSSPFMLFVHKVRPDKAPLIPAVCHVDQTARIQTVRRNQNALYYDLLGEFKARTGCGVLINTSFNTQGKPIVCTPRDAVECFFASPLDALVIGSFVIEK